jgi:hypothetical protein
MQKLKPVKSIECFNGFNGLGPLFIGGQAQIDLKGKNLSRNELLDVMSFLLLRSKTSLKELDLRYALSRLLTLFVHCFSVLLLKQNGELEGNVNTLKI